MVEPSGAAALPVDSHIKSYSLHRNTIIQAGEKGVVSDAAGIQIKAEEPFVRQAQRCSKKQSAGLTDILER